MAKAISSEELQLKKRARRRLVGAIALVLVVVIFLPMVLDNEPKPVSENIAINIPPPPDATELADETDGASAEAPSAASSGPLRFKPVEQASDSEPRAEEDREPGASTPPQQKPAAVKPPVESKPVTTASPSTSSDTGFVVQLGAFSDGNNAERLAKTVRENRFDVYTEAVTTSSGKRTRVRVGPYPTRADAEQARDRLKARKLTFGEPDIVRLQER